MKYLPLIWSGMWRKPVRTALIFLQVCVAFALFGVLQGMKSGMDRAIANVRADVLYVGPAVLGGARLALAELNRLQSVPGVKTVSFNDGMLTYYQEPTQQVYVLAIPPSDFFRTVEPEIFTIQSKDLETLRETRTGLLITPDIGKKYGWHIGDRIPLITSTAQTNGSTTWTFDIVGMFSDHERGEGSLVVANYYYLDEARAFDKGTVNHFYAIASDPKQAAAVSDAIDGAFANSASPTQTESFRERSQQAMQSLGDLNFAIRWILSAVLVALVFSTATMMMQTVRERTPELAVLKTLGFGNWTVFLLVAAESLLVCITASLAGLALAWIAFPLAAKYMAGLSMPMAVVGFGILGAVAVALISVSVPALRAVRLNIVDALAGR
ncbi:MAG TPA: FtsX-like permease family protein [Steroidobacteraceae bacterium]|nr:FtsX-like permease family protein [Steroidobacteraceae bacterium]